MASNLFYILLAILGLSLLIFIHELGHYWMARRVGMRVETFSIGFGRPIISWMRKGVKWQIGWLLFGGFVKIAGQEIEKDSDPYSVPDGFWGKSAWDRIKVAFMGPFVNIIFAILVFAILWGVGGREKNFSEFTSKIGWVDPSSELYKLGVRPGDEIESYDGNLYQGAKDNLYAPMIAGKEMAVSGYKINYETGEKQPFKTTIKPYQHPGVLEKGIKTSGILNSSNYLIYNKFENGKQNPLPEGSPMQESGIQYGDRILWVDGEIVFSSAQLNHILNDHRSLLTISRNGKTFLRRVPRVPVEELKLDPEFKEELTDWQFEAQLNGVKTQKLYAIPYNLTNDAVVENEVKFIEKEKQDEAFSSHPFSAMEEPLKPGDKIVAVDGTPVSKSPQLLAALQSHKVFVIVERNPAELSKISKFTVADKQFDKDIEWEDIHRLASTIGTKKVIKRSGNLYLLNPIQPKMQADFQISQEKIALQAHELKEKKREIEAIEDPDRRAQAMHLLENYQKQLLLGIPVQDKRVEFNPDPVTLFKHVFQEIWRTLTALVSGNMSPKWLSGPIGIVQVVHDNSMVSLKESLFWLGAISLNLGILNLLPIPVLDGGTILLSFVELITRRRLNPKYIEKIIMPFAILLIIFFVFLTYHDLSRIFGSLWH